MTKETTATGSVVNERELTAEELDETSGGAIVGHYPGGFLANEVSFPASTGNGLVDAFLGGLQKGFYS